MSIQCQKCAYVMTQAEAKGYMSAEIYNLFKNVILPALITYYVTRNPKDKSCEDCEGFIIGFLNYYKIECHVCRKYKGWHCPVK